jgi:signal transduction histidine kinase
MDRTARGQRLAMPRMSWRLLMGLAIVGLFVAVIGARAYYRSVLFARAPRQIPYADFAVGLTYMATGLAAWRRRPTSWIGPLMTAVGFAWFIGTWGDVTDWNVFRQAFGFTFDTSPKFDLFRVALWFEALSQAILVHLILAFPSGRVGSKPARVVVGTAYANVLVLGFLRAATFDWYGIATDFGVRNQGALGLWLSESAFRFVTRLYEGISVAILLALIAILLKRWRSASRPTRRALAPVWFAGSVMALSVAIAAPAFIGSVSSWQVGVCCSGALAPGGVPLVLIPAGVQQGLFWAARIGQVLIPVAFLVGLLRASLARIWVSDLVRALGEDPAPGRLREALARSLGDPSLEVVFWTSNGYVDHEGKPVVLPPPSNRAVTEIEQDSRPLGALVHDPALAEQPELVQAVGAAARLAMENERLHAEVKAQLEEVRASRARIVEAADQERRRVERDLHDGAQQRLVNLSLALGIARDRLRQGNDAAAERTLEGATEELRIALFELRELARGIHPAILADEGLGAAMESLAQRSPVPAVVLEAPAVRLGPSVEGTAYFVVAEALANVAKHSRASHVQVRARISDGALRVDVSDDGVGGAEESAGSGLRGLADRLAAVSGTLTVDSAPGRGTRVVAEIPCA